MWKSVFALILLAVLAILPAHAQAQQAPEYSVLASVYSDDNADGSFDTNENYTANWSIELYDNVFTLLDAQISNASGPVLLGSADEPSYVCLAPNDAWFLTQPQVGLFSHPDNIAWYCYQFDEVVDLDEALFGVASNDIETIPDLLDDQNSTPAPKPTPEEPVLGGAVLGATTEPQVLAETGVPAALIGLVGTTIAAISLSIRTKIYEKH